MFLNDIDSDIKNDTKCNLWKLNNHEKQLVGVYKTTDECIDKALDNITDKNIFQYIRCLDVEDKYNDLFDLPEHVTQFEVLIRNVKYYYCIEKEELEKDIE